MKVGEAVGGGVFQEVGFGPLLLFPEILLGFFDPSGSSFGMSPEARQKGKDLQAICWTAVSFRHVVNMNMQFLRPCMPVEVFAKEELREVSTKKTLHASLSRKFAAFALEPRHIAFTEGATYWLAEIVAKGHP